VARLPPLPLPLMPLPLAASAAAAAAAAAIVPTLSIDDVEIKIHNICQVNRVKLADRSNAVFTFMCVQWRRSKNIIAGA